jgi:hopene-associated glycosyltransferase HpnB
LSLLTLCASIALAAWIGVLLLPWRPWSTRERLEADPAVDDDLGDVGVVIPARNEAAVIERTLAALAAQGRGLEVWVVDDQSDDGTADVCWRFGAHSGTLTLHVIDGAPLPSGWVGKVWALEQGFANVARPYVLLLDADIELAPQMVGTLRRAARERGLDLVSIMAELRCVTFWERLLVPPFVFFFKLLYPFALVNDRRRATAAAAGGCILVRTVALRDLGGFAAIRGALIDDCAVAKALKTRGASIWLGSSHSVRSVRAYSFRDLWRMVERSAFTQLRYSVASLGVVSIVMLVMFAAPVAALAGGALAASIGVAAWASSSLAYWPTVRFYRQPAFWAPTLPFAAVLFLAMTWSSAASYWRGLRATWKNRAYQRPA